MSKPTVINPAPTSITEVDVCILGAGPGGYAAAMRAHDYGLSVCLLEKQAIGGAGVHDGVLSSKTLWSLSLDYQTAIASDRGYRSHDIQLDYRQVVQCVARATALKAEQLQQQINTLRGPKFHYLTGEGRFHSANTIDVFDSNRLLQTQIRAKNTIIATGSRPRTLPNIDVDGERILTSDHILSLPEFPQSIVILGAGVVGCEFATIFANFNQTKVYIIDRAPRILPFEDEDVAAVCDRNLAHQGVTIHRNASLVSLARQDDHVLYTIEHENGGRETISVDYALISVGRTPNTDQLNLAAAGIEIDSRGYIHNQDTRTNQPHIYAIGDITFDIALVNIAEMEGRYAASLIAGQKQPPISYQNLSTIMFLRPEVAAIGLNESQAQRAQIPYRVAVYHYELVSRAVAMQAKEGFIKLLVSDDDKMHFLGMRALGEHASTLLEAISLAMQQHCSAADFAELLHPHPAMTEGLLDCVRMLLGSSIYKPKAFSKALRLSRVEFESTD